MNEQKIKELLESIKDLQKWVNFLGEIDQLRIDIIDNSTINQSYQLEAAKKFERIAKIERKILELDNIQDADICRGG